MKNRVKLSILKKTIFNRVFLFTREGNKVPPSKKGERTRSKQGNRLLVPRRKVHSLSRRKRPIANKSKLFLYLKWFELLKKSNLDN